MSDRNATPVNPLDLPDSELSKYSLEHFVQGTEGASDGSAEDGAETLPNTGEDGAAAEGLSNDGGEATGGSSGAEGGSPEGELVEDEEGTGAQGVGSSEPSGGQPNQAITPKPNEKAPEAVKEAPKGEAEKPAGETKVIDYEAEYKRLLAPFKANGREVQVQSVDDAIALMQMGANYNKKMQALKPNLALLKLLENNGLLSEEKISYLIDLSKNDAGAINKLVKDAGIDPMDLDAEKAAGYKPTVRKVDPREVELDAVLDEIQTTPSYSKTIDVVTKQWDDASKQVVADNPQLLKVINQHVAAGIYDLIVAEVERERMFGRLEGLSDIAAYKQVGDAIQARGGFDHLGRQGQQTNQAPVVVSPKPSDAEEERRKEKKLAASAPKAATPAKVEADFNPLAMSDEEFLKNARQRFK